jgi:hypothetical protein
MLLTAIKDLKSSNSTSRPGPKERLVNVFKEEWIQISVDMYNSKIHVDGLNIL